MCIYIHVYLHDVHDIRVYLLYIYMEESLKQNPLTGPPRSRLVAHLSIKPQGLNLRSSAAGRSDFHWITWKKWWNCHKHISLSLVSLSKYIYIYIISYIIKDEFQSEICQSRIPILFRVVFPIASAAKGLLAHAHQNASRSRCLGEERQRQSGFLTSWLHEDELFIPLKLPEFNFCSSNSWLFESKFI